MLENIGIGDRVNVYFEHCPCLFDVEVLYTPAATGDCFKLRGPDGAIYNVQSYTYMKKKSPDAR